MVDGAVNLTGNMGRSFEKLSGFGEGVSSVFSLLKVFVPGKEKKIDGRKERHE